MNIKQAKEEIKHTIQAYLRKDEGGRYKMEAVKQRPVLLMGPPGIGKTAIMEQIARECRLGLVAYTITHHTRQSAAGLPLISTKEFGGKSYTVTEYTMSEIIAAVYEKIESTGIKEGILFMDEINCVSETLAPMMLQFLQCKTFGNRKLPEGWVIVAAGNPTVYNRSAREFDMVTLDRVKRLDIVEDFTVWKAYAYQKSIHESILSFLEIKKENFYHVETSVDGLRFVTARGWEDLSEMIYAYEEAEIPIELPMIGAYVQDARIARDFLAYYDLYIKYNEHYRIDAILEGSYEEGLTERFAESAFDERLSVLALLLGALHGEFVEAYRREQILSGIHEALLRVKEAACEDRDVPALDREAARLQELYEREKLSGLVTREQENIHIGILDFLRECSRQAAGKNIRDDAGIFQECREAFGMLVEKGDAAAGAAGQKLANAFSYLEMAVGGGQDMVVFVTELTADFYSLQFINSHGCEKYYQYSKELLFEDRRKKLQEEVGRLLL